MTSLDGFTKITSVSNDLNIFSNTLLSDCFGIQHHLDTIGTTGGFITIEDNLIECSNLQEIHDADCTKVNENLCIEECLILKSFPNGVQVLVSDYTLLPIFWQLVDINGQSRNSGNHRSIQEIVIQKDELLPGIYFFHLMYLEDNLLESL